MASWLDILASPQAVQGGRLNPFALARGFTQKGREGIDLEQGADLEQKRQLMEHLQRQRAAVNAMQTTDPMRTPARSPEEASLFGPLIQQATQRGGEERAQALHPQEMTRQVLQNRGLMQGQEQAHSQFLEWLSQAPFRAEGMSLDLAKRREENRHATAVNPMVEQGAQIANRTATANAGVAETQQRVAQETATNRILHENQQNAIDPRALEFLKIQQQANLFPGASTDRMVMEARDLLNIPTPLSGGDPNAAQNKALREAVQAVGAQKKQYGSGTNAATQTQPAQTSPAGVGVTQGGGQATGASERTDPMAGAKTQLGALQSRRARTDALHQQIQAELQKVGLDYGEMESPLDRLIPGFQPNPARANEVLGQLSLEPGQRKGTLLNGPQIQPEVLQALRALIQQLGGR